MSRDDTPRDPEEGLSPDVINVRALWREERDIAIAFYRLLEGWGVFVDGHGDHPTILAFREQFMVLTQEQIDVGDFA